MANYDLTYEGSRVQGILDTGDELRDAGYIFRGEATPSTVPGTPTERVAYIGGPGTYTNFGSSITVGAGCICVFKYTGSAWSNQVINTGLSDAISSEASARSQADTALQNAINSEASARQLGDSTLQGGINTVSAAITAINNAIGNGSVYAGIATPSSTPASGKVFYLAFTAGTYTNFNSLEVPQGINILKNNGSTWLLDSFLIIDDAPTQGSANLVKSGGVLNSIIQSGPAFDLSAYNAQGGVLATYADLSAALTALNALPSDFKKGGMSMKFVLTSDNKYVQFRYMGTSTANADFMNVANWQGVDSAVTQGSKNLIESGAVFSSESDILSYFIPSTELIQGSYWDIRLTVNSQRLSSNILYKIPENKLVTLNAHNEKVTTYRLILFSDQSGNQAHLVSAGIDIYKKIGVFDLTSYPMAKYFRISIFYSEDVTPESEGGKIGISMKEFYDDRNKLNDLENKVDISLFNQPLLLYQGGINLVNGNVVSTNKSVYSETILYNCYIQTNNGFYIRDVACWDKDGNFIKKLEYRLYHLTSLEIDNIGKTIDGSVCGSMKVVFNKIDDIDDILPTENIIYTFVGDTKLAGCIEDIKTRLFTESGNVSALESRTSNLESRASNLEEFVGNVPLTLKQGGYRIVNGKLNYSSSIDTQVCSNTVLTKNFYIKTNSTDNFSIRGIFFIDSQENVLSSTYGSSTNIKERLFTEIGTTINGSTCTGIALSFHKNNDSGNLTPVDSIILEYGDSDSLLYKHHTNLSEIERLSGLSEVFKQDDVELGFSRVVNISQLYSTTYLAAPIFAGSKVKNILVDNVVSTGMLYGNHSDGTREQLTAKHTVEKDVISLQANDYTGTYTILLDGAKEDIEELKKQDTEILRDYIPTFEQGGPRNNIDSEISILSVPQIIYSKITENFTIETKAGYYIRGVYYYDENNILRDSNVNSSGVLFNTFQSVTEIGGLLNTTEENGETVYHKCAYVILTIAIDDVQTVLPTDDVVKSFKLYDRYDNIYNRLSDADGIGLLEDYRERNTSFINEVVNQEADLKILVFADPHSFDEQKYRIKNDILKSGAIDMILGLGDYQAYTAMSKETSKIKISNVLGLAGKERNCFYVIGNHDSLPDLAFMGYNSKPGRLTRDMMISQKQLYSICSNNLYNEVVFNELDPYGGYYYIDILPQKLRMIVLNASDTYKYDGDGHQIYYQTNCAMQQPQATWFVEKALNFEDKDDASDWTVLVAMHTPAMGYDSLISSALVAAKNGASDFSYSHTAYRRWLYDPSLHDGQGGYDGFDEVNGDTITVSRDFSQQGPVKVIGLFYGHDHHDTLENISGGGGIKFVQFVTDNGDLNSIYRAELNGINAGSYKIVSVYGKSFEFTLNSAISTAKYIEYNNYFGNSSYIECRIIDDDNNVLWSRNVNRNDASTATEITGFYFLDDTLWKKEKFSVVCIDLTSKTVKTIPYGSNLARTFTY